MHCFSFDIETVPDVEFGRRMWNLEGVSDEDVASAMSFKQLQKTGSDFLPLHQHRVVAISVALRTGDSFRVWSLGDETADEAELVRRFFDGIDRYTPDLVSWNGSGFDLPVLHYRAMRHGVQAARYWEIGEHDRDFKWNNYLSRYHERHTDVMDVLAAYQPRAVARLDDIASILGFPGKMGMDGSKVWDNFQAGDIEGIRNYCETDVLNTYLVYLRFEMIRGRLTDKQYSQACEQVRTELKKEDKAHFREFLQHWDGAN